MRTPSRDRDRRAHVSPPPSAPPRGFLEAWRQLGGGTGLPAPLQRRGRKPRVPVSDLLPALTFHVMNGPGTLAEHFFQLFGASLADSSWSDRRARLPWQIFADLMRRMLRPRATPRRHRDAFWRGWRVLALDGTQFSLTNTPHITTTLRKARTRRGPAAFAKLTTAVLLEVGLHNPLAAAMARHGESEWELALTLLAQLPKRAVVLGDRLYGCAPFAAALAAACQRVGSHFLLRARMEIKPQIVKRLRDGSRLIRVPVRERGRRGHILEWLQVREIRVRVGRPGARSSHLRLWTSLLDPETAPALELAPLYAQRWDHEVYFRELKRQVRRTALLQSHTVETAAQEMAALVLVSALLAAERARVAAGHVPVLRVSFSKVLELVKPMWLTVQLGQGLLTDRQTHRMLTRAYALMRRCLTPARRSRTCPRAVRQPVSRWPRVLETRSIEGPWRFQLV
jgi:Transposase DDE domain